LPKRPIMSVRCSPSSKIGQRGWRRPVPGFRSLKHRARRPRGLSVDAAAVPDGARDADARLLAPRSTLGLSGSCVPRSATASA